MTIASIPLMDRTGRRTLHLYGLGGMFIFSIFITISLLIKASKRVSTRIVLMIKKFIDTFNLNCVRFYFHSFTSVYAHNNYD